MCDEKFYRGHAWQIFDFSKYAAEKTSLYNTIKQI